MLKVFQWSCFKKYLMILFKETLWNIRKWNAWKWKSANEGMEKDMAEKLLKSFDKHLKTKKKKKSKSIIIFWETII